MVVGLTQYQAAMRRVVVIREFAGLRLDRHTCDALFIQNAPSGLGPREAGERCFLSVAAINTLHSKGSPEREDHCACE